MRRRNSEARAASADRESREKYALELHQRLLQGDPVAPAELAEAFLSEIVRRLRARAGQVKDETFVLDAATDAVLAYVQQPSKFDPGRSSLLTYLTMAAYGDLLNMLAREQRRQRHQVPLEDVEHFLGAGNKILEGTEDEALEQYGLTTHEEKLQLRRKVEEMFPDPGDRRLLDLMLSGERRTHAYSEVLGIQGQAPEEQRRVVKRHKDRITKRLQRLGEKIREQRPRH